MPSKSIATSARSGSRSRSALVSTRKGQGSEGSRRSRLAAVAPQPPEPPPEIRHCACSGELNAVGAVEILQILGSLPLPTTPQEVHAGNPLGAILNQLIHAHRELVARLPLLQNLVLRQVSRGALQSAPISCADYNDLLMRLHSACDLTFGWWRASMACAEGLEFAAQHAVPGTGIRQQASVIEETLRAYSGRIERLQQLDSELPIGDIGVMALLRAVGVGQRGVFSLTIVSPPVRHGG